MHPSQELVNLFSKKPYQGADPRQSEVIVIGNDANYTAEISSHEFFLKILDYHDDGVQFWKKNKVHHPFLLNEYPFDKRKGGVKYHANFSKMGFNLEHADAFSFVELLNVPTIGNTSSDKELFFQLLDKEHLQWLEDIVFNGNKKFVIVNQTLVSNITKINKKHGALINLSNKLAGKKADSIAYESGSLLLYNGYSFSHSVSNEYLSNLGNTIREFVGDS